jgi:hypothetical protein
MGDLGREEIAAAPAGRFGNPAAKFAALAVLVHIAADRQVPVFAPERLEQAGGRPEPRIERLVDTIDVSRTDRSYRMSKDDGALSGAQGPKP